MGPFDRFNDRAKRVLALAQDEAIRFNHNYIGVEHLVLGLAREGEGVAARVLASLGVDLQKARSSVESMIGRGDATTSPSQITLSPRTKKVIELGIDEARKLGHSHVGTEHLLLGIVREGESIGAGVIQSFGVSLEQVRREVITVLGQQTGVTPDVCEAGIATPASARVVATSQWVGGADRLDAAGQRALARAYWEAGRANEKEVSPHHLLLGLIASDQIWTRKVLADLGVQPDGLVALIEAAAPRRDGPRPDEGIQTSGLGAVFARAASIAAERNRALIRPEHLLLALASSAGVAAVALETAGATQKRLRETLERMDQ